MKREGATIDLVALRLVALQVQGDAGTFVIPFDQVQNIGADAITVASRQVTQIPGADSAVNALLDLDQIGKLKVVDQAGTFLGTLAQLTIDAASGQVTELGAHKGACWAWAARRRRSRRRRSSVSARTC